MVEGRQCIDRDTDHIRLSRTKNTVNDTDAQCSTDTDICSKQSPLVAACSQLALLKTHNVTCSHQYLCHDFDRFKKLFNSAARMFISTISYQQTTAVDSLCMCTLSTIVTDGLCREESLIFLFYLFTQFNLFLLLPIQVLSVITHQLQTSLFCYFVTQLVRSSSHSTTLNSGWFILLLSYRISVSIFLKSMNCFYKYTGSYTFIQNKSGNYTVSKRYESVS